MIITTTKCIFSAQKLCLSVKFITSPVTPKTPRKSKFMKTVSFPEENDHFILDFLTFFYILLQKFNSLNKKKTDLNNVSIKHQFVIQYMYSYDPLQPKFIKKYFHNK